MYVAIIYSGTPFFLNRQSLTARVLPPQASKAAEYMFEPLTGPAPSEETGPGSHFGSTMAPSANLAGSNGTENASAVQVQEHSTGNSTNPFRRDSPTLKSGSSTHAHQVSGGTTGPGIPRREAFPPPRVEAFATYSDDPTQQHRSAEHSRTELPRSGRARGNSLTERFPGDNSVHPLDTIKHENNVARHAPHLNKKHMPGADVVDMLDDATGGRYHHEGPYDAAMLARNTSHESSPLAALKTTNQEALKATPNEKIQDSLRNHRPLDGVAEIPPGSTDEMGRRYNYEEGTDMMIANGGNYGRWPGVVRVTKSF